jgi:hypothetical protein
MATNKATFDVRTVDRRIAKGLVKDSEYTDFLKTLPDDTANAEFVQIEMENAELEDEDLEEDLPDETEDQEEATSGTES